MGMPALSACWQSAGHKEGVSGHTAHFAMLQQASNSGMYLLLQEVCFLTLQCLPSDEAVSLQPDRVLVSV